MKKVTEKKLGDAYEAFIIYVFVFRMVDEFSITFLTFCAVGIILNGIGLFLLSSLRNVGIDLTQKYILINLCFIDFSLSICLTIQQALPFFDVDPSNYQHILDGCIEIISNGYYCATFWLIFDRFLHIKLNIKYVIYWSRKKTIIAVMILWSLAVLIGSLIVVYVGNYDVVIYAGFDLVIVAFSAYVYAYALLLLKLQRSSVLSNQRGRNIFKGLFLSAIIILTFLFLVAIPDTIMAIEAIHDNSNNSGKLIWYTWLVYPVSLWTDALIYIFISPRIRTAVKKGTKRLFSYRSTTTERSESYYIKS